MKGLLGNFVPIPLAYCIGSTMLFYSGASFGLAYVIKDPAKDAAKQTQIATEEANAIIDQSYSWGELALDIKDAWSDVVNDTTNLINSTVLRTRPDVATSRLDEQSRSEPAVGLCDILNATAYVLTGDDGCSLYYRDDTQDSLSMNFAEYFQKADSTEADSLDRAVQRIARRTGAVSNYSNLASEMNMLAMEVTATSPLSEISAQDREAMDSMLELTVSPKKLVLPNDFSSNSSQESKSYVSRAQKVASRQELAFLTMQSPYIHRSQNSELKSEEHDLWSNRTNQTEFLESLAKPVTTGAGLSPRPVIYSVERNNVIEKARYLKTLYSYYQSLLVKELNMGMKTQMLNEMLEGN